MNDKKHATLSGVLMFPLCVGCRALILYEGGCLHTSKVEVIHSVDGSAIRFETRDTHYRLLPITKAQEADSCPASAMVA